MINCSEFILTKTINLLNKIFKLKKSRLDFIRIAAHSNEIELLRNCNYLKLKGYMVGINLMQVSEVTDTQLFKILDILLNTNLLYFI